MTSDDARSLVAYNEWANARFLAAVAALDEERFTRRIESSFPSIRDTLAHLVSGEWVWLQRWKGVSPTTLPEWLQAPSLDRLCQELSAVEHERTAFLSALDGARLQAPLAYRSIAGHPAERRLCDLISHVVNHSTYHRGQLATMLRQVGSQPPSTDFSLFLAERSAG